MFSALFCVFCVLPFDSAPNAWTWVDDLLRIATRRGDQAVGRHRDQAVGVSRLRRLTRYTARASGYWAPCEDSGSAPLSRAYARTPATSRHAHRLHALFDPLTVRVLWVRRDAQTRHLDSRGRSSRGPLSRRLGKTPALFDKPQPMSGGRVRFARPEQLPGTYRPLAVRAVHCRRRFSARACTEPRHGNDAGCGEQRATRVARAAGVGARRRRRSCEARDDGAEPISKRGAEYPLARGV
jgi:hypothetical protein